MISSPWAELIAWLALPLVLVATSAGVGLLVERLLRVRLPGTLLAPLGACGAIVALMLPYSVGLGARVGGPLLLALGVAGWVLARRELRATLARVFPGWVTLGAVAVYGLYLAPVVLTGGWTWTGYNFVNDTAFQFVLADWVGRHGIPYDEQLRSTTSETVRMYLATRYPVGTHVHLASLAWLVRLPVEIFYQAYIAALVALSALALATLAVRAGLRERWAAAAAAVAACASLTYNYALQGNVKEMGMLLALVTAAAAGRELLTSSQPRAMAAVLALPLAAAVAVFGAAGLPYMAAIGAVLLLAVLWQAHGGGVRRRLVSTVAVGLAVVLVAATPSLTFVPDSIRSLRGTFATASAASGGETLAHLVRPLPAWQAGGVWLADDYRLPVDRPSAATVTDAGLVLVGVLAVAGLVITLRRREVSAAALAAAAVGVYLVVAPRTSAYADAKMLAILAPAIVLCGMIGAACLARRRAWVGVGAAAIVGALVLGSAAFAYHGVRIAPQERMKAMDAIGDRYAGDTRLMLFNEFEEFAKYFLRRARINQPSEALTEAHIVLNRDLGFFGGRTFDLDDYDLAFLQRYPGIVTRIRPQESRPPANYRLELANEHYMVWRQQPRPLVRRHLGLYDERTRVSLAAAPCDAVLALAREARAGDRLVAAVAPETASFVMNDAADRPRGWPDDPERPGRMVLNTPGRATGFVSTRGGRYEAWLEASLGRPVEAYVDGRRIGSAQGINTAGGWLRVGPVSLAPGRHEVQVRRGGGGPAPGDGARSSLGTLSLVRDESVRLESVAPRDARRLCGRVLDWVELVAP